MLGRVERKMVAGVADSYDIAERTGVVVDAESGRSFGRENREALERKRGRSVGEGKGDDKDARDGAYVIDERLVGEIRLNSRIGGEHEKIVYPGRIV